MRLSRFDKIIIGIIGITISLFVTGQIIYGSTEEFEYKQSNSDIDIDIVESQSIYRKNIERTEGYNSISLVFLDKNGNKIPMNIEIMCIYSDTSEYFNIDDAYSAEIIKGYDNKDGEIQMQLQTGARFNCTFTPEAKDSIDNWEDYKSNYPMEIEAVQSGDGKLTEIKVVLDYNSSTVNSSTNVKLYA